MTNTLLNIDSKLSTQSGSSQIMMEKIIRLFVDAPENFTFNSIYQRTYGEGWEPEDIEYFELDHGGILTGSLLDSWGITFERIASGHVEIKKELFLTRDRQFLVFYHVEQYVEDVNSGGFEVISRREFALDQSLTTNEFNSLLNKMNSKISMETELDG